MKKYDIVYILKNEYSSDEIVYSVRSACQNFPFRSIWFYGGSPKGIRPDYQVDLIQVGENKWQKVNNTLRAICSNPMITESFWLFNDDFFIMKRIGKLEPMVGGSLFARIQQITAERNGADSLYSKQLRDTAKILKAKGYDRLNYALHVPMLINREKGLETLDEFKGCPMFRSLYGNHHRIGGVISDDVKIVSVTQKPTGKEKLLSTCDRSFAAGLAGEYIRDAFPDKCKYEHD